MDLSNNKPEAWIAAPNDQFTNRTESVNSIAPDVNDLGVVQFEMESDPNLILDQNTCMNEEPQPLKSPITLRNFTFKVASTQIKVFEKPQPNKLRGQWPSEAVTVSIEECKILQFRNARRKS
ncbi:hypothetical protein L1887_38224 [Cichorium endivia]|nr:hypothetical protein L1887_38224 [Cichorium endivia]